MARFGITYVALAEAIDVAFNGEVASRVLEEPDHPGDDYPLTVNAPIGGRYPFGTSPT